jgi:CheY-like chemotaxis protein
MPRRKPRVLIVEDDPDIRELLSSLLTPEGLEIAEAEDGQTALALLDENGFDLFITDVRLPPPMNGIQTVRAARARLPKLKSLFISGVSAPVWDNPRLDDFVAKPFDRRLMLGCVWELLYRDCDRGESGWM